MKLKKIKKLRDGRKTFFNRGPLSENTSKYKKCIHAHIHIYIYIYNKQVLYFKNMTFFQKFVLNVIRYSGLDLEKQISTKFTIKGSYNIKRSLSLKVGYVNVTCME